jgi:hypothetical protein
MHGKENFACSIAKFAVDFAAAAQQTVLKESANAAANVKTYLVLAC